jgi:hypothetical protein
MSNSVQKPVKYCVLNHILVWWTQPQTEISARKLPSLQTQKASSLIGTCEPIVAITWGPRRLTNLCYRDSFRFLVPSVERSGHGASHIHADLKAK